MDQSLLFLLDGDDAALKLVVTWALLGKWKDDDATRELWQARSNTSKTDVKRLWPVLVDNGFCPLSGQTEPEALKYARMRIAQKMPADMRKRKTT